MIEKVAYNLGRNDEEPNIALAVELLTISSIDNIMKI